jgi:hypothetical protein
LPEPAAIEDFEQRAEICCRNLVDPFASGAGEKLFDMRVGSLAIVKLQVERS